MRPGAQLPDPSTLFFSQQKHVLRREAELNRNARIPPDTLLIFFHFLNLSRSIMARTGRRYHFGSFLFDVIMTIITSGFWLIWVFVREVRK